MRATHARPQPRSKRTGVSDAEAVTLAVPVRLALALKEPEAVCSARRTVRPCMGDDGGRRDG